MLDSPFCIDSQCSTRVRNYCAHYLPTRGQQEQQVLRGRTARDSQSPYFTLNLIPRFHPVDQPPIPLLFAKNNNLPGGKHQELDKGPNKTPPHSIDKIFTLSRRILFALFFVHLSIYINRLWTDQLPPWTSQGYVEGRSRGCHVLNYSKRSIPGNNDETN